MRKPQHDAVHIPDAVQEELKNWSRWCWLGEWPHPLPPTHCGSLEANYRAPPDWNPDDPPPAPSMRLNDRHARIVQAVWEKLEQPARQVLKAEYPMRHLSGRAKSLAEAAYYLGMPQWLYVNLLQRGIREVEAAFALRV